MVNPPIPSQLHTEYTSKPENITKETSNFFNKSISGVTEPTIFLPKSVGKRIISSIFKNTIKTDSKKLSEFVITRPERAIKNIVAPNESIRITRNKNTYLKQLGYSKAEVKHLSKHLDKTKKCNGQEHFMFEITNIPSKKDKDLGYETKQQAMSSLNMAFTSLKSAGFSKEDAIRTIASIKNNASSRDDFSEAIGQASSAAKLKIQQNLEHKRADRPSDSIKKLGYKSKIKFSTTFNKAVKIAVDLGYKTKDAEALLEKAQKEMPVKDFMSYARNLPPLSQLAQDKQAQKDITKEIRESITHFTRLGHSESAARIAVNYFQNKSANKIDFRNNISNCNEIESKHIAQWTMNVILQKNHCTKKDAEQIFKELRKRFDDNPDLIIHNVLNSYS